jgi:hypothetical protein
MRLFVAVASIAFFAASGSAFAADCNKGMLWPYTRNPGDCLTDAEIKAGQSGVYNGPVNTNVDVSSIKPDAAAVSSGGSVSGSANTSGVSGYFSGGLLGDVLGSGSSSTTNAVSCNRGYLWPFVREPGDCLTAQEKLTNKNGVYRSAEVTQVSATNASAGDTGAGNPPANAPAPTATSAVACQRSWLWPFVRRSGDCPTDAEKK